MVSDISRIKNNLTKAPQKAASKMQGAAKNAAEKTKKAGSKLAKNKTVQKWGPFAVKTGATVGASLAGGAVGGPAGAVAAGGLAAGAMSAGEQKLKNKKVDWKKATMDGGIGALSSSSLGLGTVAGKVAPHALKHAGPAGAKLLGANGVKATALKSAAKGAGNGASVGGTARPAESLYKDFKSKKPLDFKKAAKQAPIGMGAGAVGGTVAGGLLGGGSAAKGGDLSAPAKMGGLGVARTSAKKTGDTLEKSLLA